MTIERRIVAGLDDIKAMIFECVKCGSRVCRSPDRIGEIPFHCDCGQQWRPAPAMQPRLPEPYFIEFVKAIPVLRTINRENPLGFRILFEFEEPNAK
jgi:hypothetical protein